MVSCLQVVKKDWARMIDALKEAAKILANKLNISIAEADILVFVSRWRDFRGEKRAGPLPEVLVCNGWTSRSFVVSSGMTDVLIGVLLDKGLLLPKPVERDGAVVGCDRNWVRTSDEVSTEIDSAYEEVEKWGVVR